MLQSAVNIKTWLERPPTVEEVRPARCPQCSVASCPLGGRVALHGHGTRSRQVRGPSAPREAPGFVTIDARRYRCVPCGAVIVVVPTEVLARRSYSASAIGFALALFGALRLTAAEVRQRISPLRIVGETAAVGWATLRRWARAVERGRLFPGLGPSTASTLRGVAEQAAAALSARADPSTRALPLEHRAFLGAALAA